MINFNSNVRLMPSENNRYQSIYASQSYGTFYGVFAKFTVSDIFDKDKKVVQKKKYLERIDLRLINYKGLLNISLVKGSEKDPKAYEKRLEKPSLLIKIRVKGAADGKPNLRDVITFDKPVVIEDGMNLSLVRELLSLAGQNNGDFQKGAMIPEVGGVFDEEFYERDGLLFRKKDQIGFSLSDSNDDVLGSEFDTIINLNWPGDICHHGKNQINID